MSAEDTSSPLRAELVAGFLAVISLAASVLAIFWDPIRVSPFAILLALIAVGDGAERRAAAAHRRRRVGALRSSSALTLAVTTEQSALLTPRALRYN